MSITYISYHIYIVFLLNKSAKNERTRRQRWGYDFNTGNKKYTTHLCVLARTLSRASHIKEKLPIDTWGYTSNLDAFLIVIKTVCIPSKAKPKKKKMVKNENISNAR